jgi:hypothetical protein
MSLRLLYLIFLRFLSLLVLLGRSSASKNIELLFLSQLRGAGAEGSLPMKALRRER